MKNNLLILIFCFVNFIDAAPNPPILQSDFISPNFSHASQENDAEVLFQYFLDEVELDEIISHEEQAKKVEEFKSLAESIYEFNPEVAETLTQLLLQETRVRIADMFQNAGLNQDEIERALTDNEKAISMVKDMNVEMARQMLFFVAELKIHRQYIYEFGIALGCPEKQLLRHDLCKLSSEQFEGYVRYFRGGKKESDKPAFLAAWEVHQHEEHHCESYEDSSFEEISEERLRNNMLETVSDLLASTKQRGGGPLIDRMIHVFPKTKPHPRLLPYLEEGLIKAHAFYLETLKKPDAESIFKGLPCWNNDLEEVFRTLQTPIE